MDPAYIIVTEIETELADIKVRRAQQQQPPSSSRSIAARLRLTAASSPGRAMLTTASVSVAAKISLLRGLLRNLHRHASPVCQPGDQCGNNADEVSSEVHSRGLARRASPVGQPGDPHRNCADEVFSEVYSSSTSPCVTGGLAR